MEINYPKYQINITRSKPPQLGVETADEPFRNKTGVGTLSAILEALISEFNRDKLYSIYNTNL
jgi:hypothetical protein